MASYLVTGGYGFIGSHLVDKLINLGHQVVILDNFTTGKRNYLNPQATLVEGSILDRELLQQVLDQVDGCFHLAALLGMELCAQDWLGTHQINLTGTINLFDVARSLKRKQPLPIIYTSSCAVYGDCKTQPLAENFFVQPLSAYGADKLACELHAGVASHVYHIPSVGLRLFNVYGPRQDPYSPYSGVISRFMEAIKTGKPTPIFGDGEQTRDFVFVSDVVNAFIYFMNHREYSPNVFNICTGNAITINKLTQIMGKLLGVSVEKVYQPFRVGDVFHSCGDPRKAAAAGFSAKVSLEQGLQSLV